ncbi:MAG: outer membrane protein transport protein [Leeuwenhoekiella sp.]
MKKIVCVAVLLLSVASIYAGGYRVALQGQRGLAMGHTGVAFVNSAELAFFNPAGLVYLENKINVSAGASAIFSNVAWQNEGFGQFARTDSPTGTPLYLYGSYAINDNLTLGLAVYTPYGSSVDWPTDWAGSHLVNNIELAAIFVQPLVSYKITDKISVGGGPIFVTGNVNFNRNASRTTFDEEGDRANVTIDDSGVTSWGYSVSALFRATEDLNIGVNYRSEIILDSEDGTATFSDFPNTTLQNNPGNVTKGFTASLPLPAELTIGASYALKDKYTFNFDYSRAFWDVYTDLDISFGNGVESINPRNYKDASTYRFGFQYLASEKFALRAGYYFDESPVQPGFFAPETPRNDSNGFTGGLTFNISEHFAIDASFLYLRFSEVNASYDFYTEIQNGQPTQVPFSGTYKSSAFAPGLGITYRL